MANALHKDLQIQIIKRRPNYVWLYNCVAVTFFFLFMVFHQLTDFIARRFAQTPLWSVKSLIWLTYLTLLTNLHPSFDHFARLLFQGALTPPFIVVACAALAISMYFLSLLLTKRYFLLWPRYGWRGGGGYGPRYLSGLLQWRQHPG